MGKPPKPRYLSNYKMRSENLPGAYVIGIPLGNPNRYADLLAFIVSRWAHLEDQMIAVLADLLGGTPGLPARQVFRSIISNQARKKLMLALLRSSKINMGRSEFYDDLIERFAALNEKRNRYVHGLWYSHESGKVFISEESIEDYHFYAKREVLIDELHSMINEMSALTARITGRNNPDPSWLPKSSHETPRPKRRVNKKEYRARRTKGGEP